MKKIAFLKRFVTVVGTMALLLLVGTAWYYNWFSPGQGRQSGAPEKQRIEKLVDAINSENRSTVLGYIRGPFAKEYLDAVPMDHLVDRLLKINAGSNFKLHSLRPLGQKETSALLEEKKSNSWVAMTVIVDNTPPYNIQSLDFRLTNPPNPEIAFDSLTEEQLVKYLSHFLDRTAEADRFSDTVLLTKDGRSLLKRAYGLASKEYNIPNLTDTKFNLGSMNQMFTAIAFDSLTEEQGKLSFNDPISKYLTDWLPFRSPNRFPSTSYSPTLRG